MIMKTISCDCFFQKHYRPVTILGIIICLLGILAIGMGK